MITSHFKSSLLEIPNALAIFSKVERVGFIRPFSMLLIYALSTLKAVARSPCDIFFFKRSFLRFSPSFFPDDINTYYENLHSFARVQYNAYMSAPNSPKTKSVANGKFLPKPLLFHLRHPNSKANEPKFCKILFPKNSFAKTSSALFRHLPEYLEGRTPKEKHPFLFQKKFHPRPIKKARSVFLSGLPRLCEAVAEPYERTRQFRATTRSARAISRHQGCFQNTFELCTMNTAKIWNHKKRIKRGRADLK